MVTTACAYRCFPQLECAACPFFVQALLVLIDVAPAESICGRAADSGLGDVVAKVLLLGSLETGAPLTQHLIRRRGTHGR